MLRFVDPKETRYVFRHFAFSIKLHDVLFKALHIACIDNNVAYDSTPFDHVVRFIAELSLLYVFYNQGICVRNWFVARF